MKYTVKRRLRFSGKAMKEMTPDEVVEEVKKSSRSWWCWFPCWIEMEFY
jgi:hypothetical protein